MSEVTKTLENKAAVSVSGALNEAVPFTIGERVFDARAQRMRESVFISRAVQLDTQTRRETVFEKIVETQQLALEAIAHVLTMRAVDGKEVTAEWVGDQDAALITEFFALIVGGAAGKNTAG